MPEQKQHSGLQLAWTTITYRTIALMLIAAAGLGLITIYLLFPEQSHKQIARTQSAVTGWLNRVTGNAGAAQGSGSTQQQARFTSFDGTVRVRKVNSNTWIAADYSLPLEKGDVVQTMSAGIAKIAFADGSTYSIQPDSLVTIEENSTNAQQQVEVAVRLQTGTFQLNTGDIPSTQQIRIDNATTTVGKDSALEAVNDRKKGPPAVLVTKGVGTFEMNGQRTAIAPYERVSFNPEDGTLKKEKEIAPPVLLAPANMMPIFVSGKERSFDFSWTPVENVKQYHVRISLNPYFSSITRETTVSTPYWRVNGLDDGKYYWQVQSVEENGKESIPSETMAFTVVQKGNMDVSLPLELEPFIQHGHVIEIKGKTEQGARVMVNGEQVPVVDDNGGFIFFTPALPTGENIITITAQNKSGGVSTKTEKVVIE